MIKRKTISTFLKTLSTIQYGKVRVTLPDNTQHEFEGPKPGYNAEIQINDWHMILHLAAKGDIGFAEDYRDGLWTTPSLDTLLNFAIQNEEYLTQYFFGNIVTKLVARIYYFFHQNSLKGSKRNIHAHYDLGNEFYKLWLDPSMTYSSAIFKSGEETLQQAQHNKYSRILNKLNTSGSILEIGCGWGGFAEHALKENDYNYKGITLSTEQHDFTKKRLPSQAHIALEDYRTQNEKFDHIVSIEMFEAVGEKYWPQYFNKIASLLKKPGKAIIQTITIKDEIFARYKKTGDNIRNHIFPGGMLPSPTRFNEEVQKARLQITDHYYFGEHYAKTLLHWLKNFDQQQQKIRHLGFDERFTRMWRFYLASCSAAFTSGRINVLQAEIKHA